MTKRIVTLSLFLAMTTTAAWAEELMTKTQYEDYAVLYHCTDAKVYDDLKDKDADRLRIDEKFGINDDNFEAIDRLIVTYEQDEALRNRILERVNKECKR